MFTGIGIRKANIYVDQEIKTFPTKCPQKMGHHFLLNSNDATMYQTFTHDWPLTITLLVLFNILHAVFQFAYISTSISQLSRISTLLLMVCPDSLCNVINAQTNIILFMISWVRPVEINNNLQPYPR